MEGLRVIRPESRQGLVAGYERYRLISPTSIVFCFFTGRCSASLLSFLSRRTFMNELDRRSLLKAITAVPFAYCEALSVPSQEPVSVVASHTDRTGHPHKAARANSHLDFKVLTRETNGRVFIMENRDMVRGGPPRHVHYEQGEWVFFLEGGGGMVGRGEKEKVLRE